MVGNLNSKHVIICQTYDEFGLCRLLRSVPPECSRRHEMLPLRRFSYHSKCLQNHVIYRKLSSRANNVLSSLNLSESHSEIPGVYDGEWGGSGEVFESICPSTREVIGRVRSVCQFLENNHMISVDGTRARLTSSKRRYSRPEKLTASSDLYLLLAVEKS